MSAEENKVIVRCVFEKVWNKGNLEVVDEVFATNYVFHGPANSGVRGPEGYKQHVTIYRTAFPDVQFTVEDMLTEGDKVAIHWTARGTHQGYLMGIAPTLKRGVVTGFSIVHIADGKIVEEWSNWDTMSLMQQWAYNTKPVNTDFLRALMYAFKIGYPFLPSNEFLNSKGYPSKSG